MDNQRAKKIISSLQKFLSHFTFNRDAAAVVLAGGVVTLLVSLSIIVLSIQDGEFLLHYNYISEIFLGILPGVLEIISGAYMARRDDKHSFLGGISILFALISLPGSDGGLFIGFILVFIGSIMSVLFKGPFRYEDNET